MTTLGQKLYRRRAALGLIQAEVAARAVQVDPELHLTQPMISTIERGGPVTVREAIALAKALGIPLGTVLQIRKDIGD
jgi:transcriptional regulator with XRE-family HTH domain